MSRTIVRLFILCALLAGCVTDQEAAKQVRAEAMACAAGKKTQTSKVRCAIDAENRHLNPRYPGSGLFAKHRSPRGGWSGRSGRTDAQASERAAKSDPSPHCDRETAAGNFIDLAHAQTSTLPHVTCAGPLSAAGYVVSLIRFSRPIRTTSLR